MEHTDNHHSVAVNREKEPETTFRKTEMSLADGISVQTWNVQESDTPKYLEFIDAGGNRLPAGPMGTLVNLLDEAEMSGSTPEETRNEIVRFVKANLGRYGTVEDCCEQFCYAKRPWNELTEAGYHWDLREASVLVDGDGKEVVNIESSVNDDGSYEIKGTIRRQEINMRLDGDDKLDLLMALTEECALVPEDEVEDTIKSVNYPPTEVSGLATAR